MEKILPVNYGTAQHVSIQERTLQLAPKVEPKNMQQEEIQNENSPTRKQQKLGQPETSPGKRTGRAQQLQQEQLEHHTPQQMDTAQLAVATNKSQSTITNIVGGSEQLRTKTDKVQFSSFQSNSNEKVFTTLEQLNAYLNKTSTLEIGKLRIEYDNFTITEPLFVTPFDRILFYRSAQNVRDIQPRTQQQLIGIIELIRNGTLVWTFDCGYKTSLDLYKPNWNHNESHSILLPLNVPDGGYFQHFTDGVWPKLVQIKGLLARPEIKLLLPRPMDRTVLDFLQLAGVPLHRVLWRTSSMQMVYHADYFISSCITPPLHPWLWKGARDIMGKTI